MVTGDQELRGIPGSPCTMSMPSARSTENGVPAGTPGLSKVKATALPSVASMMARQASKRNAVIADMARAHAERLVRQLKVWAWVRLFL